jgi:hypothetical protein
MMTGWMRGAAGAFGSAARAARIEVVAPLALAMLVLPGVAAACPMCASQQPGGTARVVALGLMIVLPFAIAGFVFRALGRLHERPDAVPRPPHRGALVGRIERGGVMRKRTP